jgi:tRNA (cytidine/uridine-2'-O-)-methyltransferase
LNIFPEEQRIAIPMFPNNRSLNLSNSVAIVTYEAWRQLRFKRK